MLLAGFEFAVGAMAAIVALVFLIGVTAAGASFINGLMELPIFSTKPKSRPSPQRASH